jgi:hypothetical protein
LRGDGLARLLLGVGVAYRLIRGHRALSHGPDQCDDPADECPPKKNIKDKYRALVPVVPFVGDQGWNKVNNAKMAHN